MLLHVFSHPGEVAEQLIGYCVHALDALLVVQADGAIGVSEAGDVHTQHVHFEGDRLLGEVEVEFGAEGTTLLGERSELVWAKEAISGVEFVAGSK